MSFWPHTGWLGHGVLVKHGVHMLSCQGAGTYVSELAFLQGIGRLLYSLARLCLQGTPFMRQNSFCVIAVFKVSDLCCKPNGIRSKKIVVIVS